MSKWLALAATSFLFLACTTVKVERIERSISSEQCPVDPKYPPLFNVVQNNQERIVVELGNFGSLFDVENAYLNFKIVFRGSKENKEDKDQLIDEGSLEDGKTRITVPVKKTGVYYFTVYKDEKSPLWKQKVFAIAPTEHTLTAEDRQSLAQQYAPVLSYHDQELYFPVSLSYLANVDEPDSQLRSEPFILTNKKIKDSFFSWGGSKSSMNIEFQFQDILNILPYYGHSESVLKSGLDSSANSRLKLRYGKDHVTVYYSIFENPKYKEIYINYHFFYSYDPKNGTAEKDALPAHIFDRESMTVVLRSTTRQPLSVFYGAHLASQVMGQMDPDGRPLQKWDTGRVFVNWPEVNKIGNHPIPAIALGSHGVYPKTGLYAVYVNNSPTSTSTLLKEPAGGKKMLYPEFMTEYQKTATSFAYKLEDLKLDQVTSDCSNPHRILAFSGSTVDVLGPVNATFPPFTDREEDYFSYADPNAPMFDMKK